MELKRLIPDSSFPTMNQQAIVLSQQASELLRANRLDESLALYKKSFDLYAQTKLSLLGMCNAAGCLRNMGSIYRLLKAYKEATQCWKQAEQFYSECREEVKRLAEEDNQVVLEDALCIDALMTETLQSRAAIHYKHLAETTTSIQCHQSALALLILLDEAEEWEDMFQHVAVSDGVVFRPLDKEKHTSFLTLSIERMTLLIQEEECDLSRMRAALSILHRRFDENSSEEKIRKTLINAYRQLAHAYDENLNAEEAAEVIQCATDVEITTTGEPDEDTVAMLDHFGSENEESDNLDQALTYFEKALLVKSKWLGDRHIEVAKALINIARVMEAQGNSEGSMDLYQVAQSIYADKVQSKDFLVQMQDADAILQLVPTLMEQERYEELVRYLNKCLEFEEQCDEDVNFMDRSQLYFALAKAYIGLCDFVSATVCLVEAAKVNGAVSRDLIHSTLEKVELLKKERSLGRDDASLRREVLDEDIKEVAEKALDEDIGLRAIAKSKPLITQPVARRARGSTPATSGTGSGDSVSSAEDGYKGGAEETDRDLDSDFNDSIEEEFRRISRTDTSDVLSGIELSVDAPPMQQKGVVQNQLKEIKEDQNAGSSSDRKDGKGSDSTSNKDPQTSDTQDSIKKRRGFRLPGSPRRINSDGSRMNELSPIGRFRMRKNGFASLPEEKDIDDMDNGFTAAAENPYRPIEFVSVSHPDTSFDDNVSQITIPVVVESMQKDSKQEWWWGVTAEGFGRWFPTSVVSKAVEAAEGFLSAEAIHSKVRAAPLRSGSDDTSKEQKDEDLPPPPPPPLNQKEKDSLAREIVSSQNDTKETNKTRNAELVVKTDNQEETIFSITTPLAKREEFKDQVEDLKKSIEGAKRNQASAAELAALHARLAVVLRRSNDTAGALDFANEALQFERVNGKIVQIIGALKLVAELYMQQREFKQSLSHYNEVLRLCKKEYGNYSEETASALNCLGSLRAMENQFGLAMDYHQEALTILKECRGEDLKDPLVSQTLCLIGSVYYRERNSLSTIKSKKRGDYTTFIEAGMLEVIGRAHEDRGSYKMAISFFEEKLQFIKDDEYDADDFITTLNSLGMLSLRAGLYPEALDYFDRALNVQVREGYDEIYIVTTRVLTAAVHHQLGDYARARDMLMEALIVLKNQLGDHETVAAILYHIGAVEIALCDLDKAMAALQEARRLQEDILGIEHPATLRTIREIGGLFGIYEAELGTAFKDFDFVLKTQREIHGEKHPNIAETLHCIGCAYAKRKDYSEALRWLEECYYMRLEFLGVDHPHQATTLLEIAKIHLARGRGKRALQICDTVIEIRKDSLGQGHVDVARAQCQKGECLTAQGGYSKAEACFNEAFSIATRAVGPNHPFVAEVFVAMANMQLRKCQFDEARSSIAKAQTIYAESNLDNDFYGIVEANQLLEKIERDETLYV